MKSEIVKTERKTFKAGQLYIATSGNVVLCTLWDNDTFSGVVIVSDGINVNVGEYKTDWIKDCFTLFTGEIKLTQ